MRTPCNTPHAHALGCCSRPAAGEGGQLLHRLIRAIHSHPTRWHCLLAVWRVRLAPRSSSSHQAIWRRARSCASALILLLLPAILHLHHTIHHWFKHHTHPNTAGSVVCPSAAPSSPCTDTMGRVAAILPLVLVRPGNASPGKRPSCAVAGRLCGPPGGWRGFGFKGRRGRGAETGLNTAHS
jgi:hypothetical protein